MKSILAKRLREVRIAKGLSTQALSDMTGIHYNSIMGYERGSHEPTIFKLILLAYELEVSIDWLVGRNCP